MSRRNQNILASEGISGYENLRKTANEWGNSGSSRRRNVAAAADAEARRIEKAMEREARKQEREAERQARAAQREAEKANREAEREMNRNAIAWFTDKNGNKIPITAPSGGRMKQWDQKSGTMFDEKTGLAYRYDPKEKKVVPIDVEKDGKTVVKDGHVYKVVPGMGWKWMGSDGINHGNHFRATK